MSENFPFAAVEEDSGGDRKKMFLVAGLGALMVAVLGYFVVVPALAGGGDDAAPVTQVKAPPKKDAKAKAKSSKKKAAKKKAPAQPASYSDLSARTNPFKELYLTPKAPTMPGGTTGGGAYVPPTSGGTGGGTGAPGSSTGGTNGSSASVGGQRVALMTVYSKEGVQYAQTRVGDTVYTPKVGQVFATSYKLLAVSGKTATYLFGDEQFTLQVGQEVLK